MNTLTQRSRIMRRAVRPALAAACLLALTGCIAYPGGYYGAGPGYPAYAAYPSYGYYAAPPVGIVVGGGWGRGWRHWN